MLRKKSKANAFFSGVLFGSLVGATVALLYAPQTGDETRTVIRNKSMELKDRAVESGEQMKKKAEEAAEQARVRFEETAGVTKEKAAELQKRGQAFIETQRERIKTVVEAGKQSFASTPQAGGMENGGATAKVES